MGTEIDWQDVLCARKHGVGRVPWTPVYTAGVIVRHRFDFETSVTTDAGTFSLRAVGKWLRADAAQLRLVAFEGHQEINIARLCVCPQHGSDEHPAHWHWIERGKGTRTVTPAVEVVPPITRSALEEAFMLKLKFDDWIAGMFDEC